MCWTWIDYAFTHTIQIHTSSVILCSVPCFLPLYRPQAEPKGRFETPPKLFSLYVCDHAHIHSRTYIHSVYTALPPPHSLKIKYQLRPWHELFSNVAWQIRAIITYCTESNLEWVLNLRSGRQCGHHTRTYESTCCKLLSSQLICPCIVYSSIRVSHWTPTKNCTQTVILSETEPK